MDNSKSPTKLIAYRGDRSACWLFRVHSPLLYMQRANKDDYEVTVASAITKEQIGAYEMVILQRQYKMDVLAPALEMKKKGSKLIYEIDDDLFHIPDWNPAAKVLSVKSVQEGIRRFLSSVDAIFVTTNDLAKVYADYCEHIYVLPNSIDYEIIYPVVKNTVRPVICWQGSTTHAHDLEIARKGFERIAQDKDTLLKLWCGVNYKTREPLFEVPGAEILQLVAFENFYPMFSQIGTHIGLAPLCANQFNRSKSNLKFLEYTVHDAVTVASNFGPYAETIEDGVTGILVSDNRDWYDKTRMLIDQPELHSRILENAKKLVFEKYNIGVNYKLWENALNEVHGVGQ